jgi:hypothetical protein
VEPALLMEVLPAMTIKFSDLEMAFFFVGSDQPGMHNAYLDRETGHIFYTSEMGDSDDLPEDIFETDRHLEIPHKNDLNLGKALVLDFTAASLPDELDRVQAIFRKKGAYSRFKDLLENRGLLAEWYAFEEKRQTTALKEWCREQELAVE